MIPTSQKKKEKNIKLCTIQIQQNKYLRITLYKISFNIQINVKLHKEECVRDRARQDQVVRENNGYTVFEMIQHKFDQRKYIFEKNSIRNLQLVIR